MIILKFNGNLRRWFLVDFFFFICIGKVNYCVLKKIEFCCNCFCN